MFQTSRSALCGGLCLLSLTVTPFVLGGCRTMVNTVRNLFEESPEEKRERLRGLTADQAFAKLRDDERRGQLMDGFVQDMGFQSLSSEEVNRQAYDRALAESQGQVSNEVVEEIARQFKDSCVATLFPNFDTTGPRYSIYIPDFPAKGNEVEHFLAIDTLNGELRRTLRANDEFKQRFRLIACTSEQAERYLTDISGMSTTANDPSGGPELIDPNRVCRLTGSWSASKRNPASKAPRLVVTSFVSAVDPKRRSVIDDQKFVVSLVYHPTEGWCTEQADAARAAAAQAEAVAMNKTK